MLRLLFGLAVIGSLISRVVAVSPEPIEISELPAPPEEIRRLIDRGPLDWESGHRDDRDQPDDAPQLAAETEYRIKYFYHARNRWIVNQDRTQVTVTAQFTQIEWNPTHRIWLRRRPVTDMFWSDEIVLHELDHLRISSDPRHEARFKQRLRTQTRFVCPITAGDVVNKQFIDRLVHDHVDRVFQEHIDLIAIRYKELDRITKHGQRPVPQESAVAKLLSESTDPTD